MDIEKLLYENKLNVKLIRKNEISHIGSYSIIYPIYEPEKITTIAEIATKPGGKEFERIDIRMIPVINDGRGLGIFIGIHRDTVVIAI